MRALPISRTARNRFELDGTTLAPATGTTRLATDLAVARRVATAVNGKRAPGEPSAQAGELAALELLHEIFHMVVARAAELVPESGMDLTADAVTAALGAARAGGLLDDVGAEFPDVDARPTPTRLEELLLIRVANENPAARPLRALVDDTPLVPLRRDAAITAVEQYEAGLPGIGPDGSTLLELLRAPARAHPTSLAGQLRYIRERWGDLLGDALDTLLDRMVLTLDVIGEEERALHLRFGGGADGGAGGGRGEAPDLTGLDAEPERFSSDSAWMPRLVLIAKSTHVWLDQLSRRYGTAIRTLDAIPDEELDRLARWGITGLWLIGLWERSPASQRIKVWRGNPDAAASAYSLDDYVIAEDLGGEAAWADLRQRAWQRGVRLASDMVPNHMGIDSRWVTEHPEWFLQTSEPPYPGYAFNGENVAEHDRVEIRLEDHYWDNSDAAVVFERRDRHTGERQYIYHGNDGTSFPWNDTAQLDFLKADVREVVIRTILDVARRFPVIRFDAAMVLAKKHVERLWYPEPGAGGAIPSRAEHAIAKAAFDRLMPEEFWREVVDRVAAEAPDTLLLAEAFWLLEGYFVRTLGMHRVYNSAFMHMIRDEDNAGYRKVIRETVEFDPAILGRYVNFLTNPDEETAIEQFGTGDKYFGAATLLATLPGLPMIGHGQIEGFTEKYGMEFQRARLDESPNPGLIAHFEAQIVPLLRERRRFAGSADFRLYDVVADGGSVVEDVFAYSNGLGAERSVIVYHNRFGEAAGWIRESVAFAIKADEGTKTMRRDALADALGLGGPADGWLRFRDRRSGLESLRSVGEIRDRGLFVDLGPYECLVLDDLREVTSTAEEPWSGLAGELHGRGVPSLDEALADHRLRPIHEAVGRLLVAMTDEELAARRTELLGAAGLERRSTAAPSRHRRRATDGAPTKRVAPVPAVHAALDPAARAAVRLRPLDRAAFDRLRLATALRVSGMDPSTIERTRVALELAHPVTTPDATALAAAWLADPEVRAYLQVHEWDGVEWLVRDRWLALVVLADALDRAAGAARPRPAIAHLRPAAEAAGDRVDAIEAGLAGGTARRRAVPAAPRSTRTPPSR